MRKTTISIVIALAAPMVVWLAGGALAASYDRPPLPPGTHLLGSAAKGTLTLNVIAGTNTLSFSGVCMNKPVSFTDINVTALFSPSGFAAVTGEQVAAAIENWFTDDPLLTGPFNTGGCYNKAALGIYVTVVNRVFNKSATQWVGEVIVQGVRP